MGKGGEKEEGESEIRDKKMMIRGVGERKEIGS